MKQEPVNIQKTNFYFKDALVSISLANLLFLRVWRELLFADEIAVYWLPDFTSATYLGVILNVLWAAAAIFGATVLIRKIDNAVLTTIGRIGFLMLFVFPLEYLRTVLGIEERDLHYCLDHPLIFGTIGLFIVAIAAHLQVWRLAWVVRTLRWVLLALAPLAVITLPHAAYRALAMQPDIQSIDRRTGTPENSLPSTSRPRIIWLLFDELDSRLAFSERPDDIALPNFDRLRAQSVLALNGESHGQNTMSAIPSYFTGRIVTNTQIESGKRLRIGFQGQTREKMVSLANAPNIFSAVRDRGKKGAVIGIYHPYHRLIGEDLEYCSSYMMNTYTPSATSRIGREMMSQIEGITPVFRRINAIKMYQGVLNDCTIAAVDPRYDILFVHIPVPHGPHIYRRATGKFSLVNIAKDCYLDSLVLADIFLGQIRNSLESMSMWDESVIVVTSDHELREVEFGDKKRVDKIPFLMKLPGQDNEVIFDKRFSPKMVSKDLFLAVLDGEVETPDDVILWLNRKTTNEVASNR